MDVIPDEGSIIILDQTNYWFRQSRFRKDALEAFLWSLFSRQQRRDREMRTYRISRSAIFYSKRAVHESTLRRRTVPYEWWAEGRMMSHVWWIPNIGNDVQNPRTWDLTLTVPWVHHEMQRVRLTLKRNPKSCNPECSNHLEGHNTCLLRRRLRGM